MRPEDGRRAVIHRFDGATSRESVVEREGVSNYTYSRRRPNEAEEFFSLNFEDDYPAIARNIIAGRALRGPEKFHLFLFALVTKFRSPTYRISTGEERIDVFESIMGSALNHIEPLRSDDWQPGCEWNHLRRVYAKYALKIVHLPIRIFISEDPCHIFNKGDLFAAVIVLPITPSIIAVFYRRRLVTCRSEVSPRDVEHLLLAQRQSRTRFLYYPLDLSQICRPGQDMPPPSGNLSAVRDGQVSHHYQELADNFDFLQ